MASQNLKGHLEMINTVILLQLADVKHDANIF